ncbi:MAG: hypothetical protein VB080_05420 [Propionicimonas sp.]|nr:hypothetical protein [Propionicimonas sp.]MEA4943864.1 hypothetical protein [Propionicimonas sp.]
MRLAQAGFSTDGFEDSDTGRLVAPVLARQRELSRRLADRLCAADQRIQNWLDDCLADTGLAPRLPRRTFVLDEPGLARELSLPQDGDSFSSPLLSSYRLANGVLHNPANDRRTTAGVFHIAEGGLPIPDDKIAVRKDVFARLVELAFTPPEQDLVLPYTANQATPAACFVSLLLRPLVSPEVPGWVHEKRLETRFIVPGGLVANLDFVEGIFGNGGDPYLPENDASLAPGSWTGHTGLVVLAPHLTKVTKKELGLPHVSEATDRQRRDGQCWEHEDERYNNGQAFKVCARDTRGVIVTVIADNYFGYCKKEVKSQISYSANLFGNAEEEHAGGALVYPSYNLGQEYHETSCADEYTLAEVLERDPERFHLQPEGHALDGEQPHIVLVPANARYSLRSLTVTWTNPNGSEGSIRMRADKVYLSPNGYRVEMKQLASDRTQWSLTGTAPVVTSCHKPATVSGGGKSEISKAISDAIIFGNAYAPDIEHDLDEVAQIIDGNYSGRFADPAANGIDHRPILADNRSIGSVIKLLTPSDEFHADYNAWLASIPPHILELVFVVKRFYRPEWGADWRSHFTVGRINGRLGNNLRLDGDKITVNMLRVGFADDGSWRLFGLRHDFHPAVKVQTEDDITASTVIPGALLDRDPSRSYKLVQNCEELLFQRPDDAIHRGYDKQTERDLSQPGTFLSNFQPLSHADARELRDDAVNFSFFTEPMADLLSGFADTPEGVGPDYVVSSANPRLVDGKPSKNPRYLQQRPDRTNAAATATADLASHLFNRKPADTPLPLPVDVVAAGRRNNPPEPGVPPLSSYNPLHYMELPELFMEFISSMTGKSPSTTGAGSEGALTKGPFNPLPAIIDLNAALLSYALTGYDGWVSGAGFVGPKVRVDHDISMLVPEVFSRMSPAERDARHLLAEGCLEKLEDVEFDGRLVPASRLGYRMTQRFATKYFGRIFLHPHVVFTDEMLRPELQDPAIFAESIAVIVATHQRVAQAYFDDGTISLAVPPLRALLEIMAHGHSCEGWGLDSPEFRAQFTREHILDTGWYHDRLDAKQAAAVARATNGLAAIEKFIATPGNEEPSARLDMPARIEAAKADAERFASPQWRERLVGTVGGQPL